MYSSLLSLIWLFVKLKLLIISVLNSVFTYPTLDKKNTKNYLKYII